MEVNVDRSAVLRQAQMKTGIEALMGNGEAETAPLMSDVALVVETIATEAAIKRFTPTEEDRRQERLRENRNKEAEQKRLVKKDIAKKEEEKQLAEEFAANLLYKA